MGAPKWSCLHPRPVLIATAVKLIDVYPNDVPEPPRKGRSRRWPGMNWRSVLRSSAAAT